MKQNPVFGIHVIEANTKFQQYRCITFEDLNISLSASAIFGAQIVQLSRKRIWSTVNLIVKVCVMIIIGCLRSHPSSSPAVKCERQKMEMALTKMFVSSKVMH